MTGKTPREIFEAHGFDVTLLGIKRVKQSADRWKKAYDHGGIMGYLIPEKKPRVVRWGESYRRMKSLQSKDAVDQGPGRMTRYLCSLLNVSRSGYYSYVHAADSLLEWAHSDAEAGQPIEKAIRRRGYKKGSRSIKMILEHEFGVIYNLKKIRRLMKKFNDGRDPLLQRIQSAHIGHCHGYC